MNVDNCGLDGWLDGERVGVRSNRGGNGNAVTILQVAVQKSGQSLGEEGVGKRLERTIQKHRGFNNTKTSGELRPGNEHLSR